jgi:hypothetical protein
MDGAIIRYGWLALVWAGLHEPAAELFTIPPPLAHASPDPQQRVVDQPREGAARVEAPTEAAQAGQTLIGSVPDLLDEGGILTDAAVELDPRMSALRSRIRRVLALYYRRPVNARDHTPWEVMHWVIAYNVDAQIFVQGPGGETTTAVGWLCYNRPCRGQTLLNLRDGRITALYGVGLEGHTGQLMAILGQSRVMADYPMMVGNRQFTVADLVETQKLTCQSNTELTFQLIGLAHYLDLDETWRNSAGEVWSIPRLIREEISKPIHGSACGGTHRLMGLSYAVKKRQRDGDPVDGEYRRAEIYINDYIDFTLRMQNPDGSFSTEWFSGRGARPDVDRRVQTTGHILEWLVFAASDEQLLSPPFVKATEYLSRTLANEPGRDWKIGPLGHALRALSLYDRRVFKPLDPSSPEPGKDSADNVLLTEPAAREPAGVSGVEPGDAPAARGVDRAAPGTSLRSVPRTRVRAGADPSDEALVPSEHKPSVQRRPNLRR